MTEKRKQKAPSTSAAVYMHVSELRRNPKNPRLHGPEVAKLARLILRTAFGAPFVVQKRSHTIIAGHGRLDACELILAGMVVDDEQRGGPEYMFDPDAPGPGFVPVRVVDVSDATRDTMTVADNAQGLQGRDDAALLLELLAPHGRGSSILDDLGFNDSVLDGLVSGAGDAVLGDPPRFDPAAEEDQSHLDERAERKCPHCGGTL
jgi:ParB-like chromosome segregation protein Spo0J